jgi:hypothetical protein
MKCLVASVMDSDGIHQMNPRVERCTRSRKEMFQPLRLLSGLKGDATYIYVLCYGLLS